MSHERKNKLLVYGYISRIEKSLLLNHGNIIIPKSIILLCLEFYKNERKIMYHIHQGYIPHKRPPITLYIAEADKAKDDWKRWKCIIKNIDSSEFDCCIDNGGTHLQRNIKLH